MASALSNIIIVKMRKERCDTSMEHDWMIELYVSIGMLDLLKDVNMVEVKRVDKFVMNIEQITMQDEEDMAKSSSIRSKILFFVMIRE